MKQFAKISFFILFSLFLFNCSGAKPKTVASTSIENQNNSENIPISESKSSSTNEDPKREGGSIKTAIKVKSIAEEYQIVKQLCPSCKVKGQALISEGKKHYDLLNTVNDKGEEIKYYFDINSFFGKW
ncbi:hypothetical protein [Flavobacterium ginsenosidimutans]|uniref:Lipoprotein n=1 Tax=Flavobacterium ginsenosidimutans TaxID=687844 RepID=A0ABZ2QBL0_9FLAO